LDTLTSLSALSDDALPLVAVHKELGLRYAYAGKFEDAMKYLQAASSGAENECRYGDARAHAAFGYLADPDIDRALGMLGRTIPSLWRHPPSDAPVRLLVLVPGLLDENSQGSVVLPLLEGFRERGYAVDVLSSEYGDSKGSSLLARYRERGFHVTLAPRGGAFRERVEAILRLCAERSAHAALYIATPADAVMKVVSEIGVAPAQLFVNTVYEHHCGAFDYVLQTVSPEQEKITYWPGKSKYVGAYVMLGPEIDRASAFDRAELGIADNALVAAVFGRLQKCSSEYVAVVARILAAEPRAVLLLAGPGTDRETQALRSFFERFGVAKRVHMLGPRLRDVPALLKTIDVYLDSFPWPGGQSILEAMWAGVPIVAMGGMRAGGLDPLGAGPTSSTSRLLPVGTEIASSREAYERIALAYLRDEKKRRKDGARLRDFVVAAHSFNAWIDTVERYVREARITAACNDAVTSSASCSVMRG
jgi:glycosyltransferase involved in cell wall biosynthesis